jgi:Zinc carboxypeptidase
VTSRAARSASAPRSKPPQGTEVDRRLLNWYIDRWRANDKDVKQLLKDNELWFVLIHNPDGYQYTFDVERLWRKNLRDNDGNGTTNANDGVDPNRNYNEHWNYDDEGSSSLFPSQTYRGPAPESEPETQAMVRLFDKVPFRFAISYHAFSPLLLYPAGVADAHALGRRPHLHRPDREGHRPGGGRLQPGGLGRPVHHQRRVHRLGVRRPEHPGLDTGAWRGLRFRLP